MKNLFGDTHLSLRCMVSYSGKIEPSTDEHRLYVVADNAVTGRAIEKRDARWIVGSCELKTNGGKLFAHIAIVRSSHGRKLAKSPNYPHGRLALKLPPSIRETLGPVSHRLTGMSLNESAGGATILVVVDLGAARTIE